MHVIMGRLLILLSRVSSGQGQGHGHGAGLAAGAGAGVGLGAVTGAYAGGGTRDALTGQSEFSSTSPLSLPLHVVYS
jgi:hypothetical protein